jgi:hypothetical protein
VWAHAGGAELALTNAAIAVEQALEGPGAYSLDRLLRVRLPRPLVAAAAGLIAAGVAAAIALSLRSSRAQEQEEQAQPPAAGGGERPEPVLGWVPSGAGSRS